MSFKNLIKLTKIQTVIYYLFSFKKMLITLRFIVKQEKLARVRLDIVDKSSKVSTKQMKVLKIATANTLFKNSNYYNLHIF